MDKSPGSAKPLRVLIVEDEPADAELMVARLKQAGYSLTFHVLDSLEQFQTHMQSADYDLILADYNLRSWTALDALSILKQSGKDIPLVVVTGALGDVAAVECVKQGAADYVLKDHLERLPAVVDRALRDAQYRREAARLQDEVRRAKEEWELTFAAVPDAVFLLDEHSHITRANRAAGALAGAEPAQLLGRYCYEVVHGLTEPHPDCPHQRLLQTGREEQQNMHEPRVNKFFDVTTTPVHDAEGVLRGCVHVMRDITERNQAEVALRESERRYRTVARLSSDFAYSCTHEGEAGYVIDWITDAFFTLTGFSEAELRERRCWLTLSHPEDRETATEPLRRLRPGESDTREFRIVTKEGRVLSITNHLECAADSEAPGGLRIYGAVRDITERKQAAAALRQQNEMRLTILDNIPVMVAFLDREGHHQYVNRCWQSTLGWSLEETLHKDVLAELYPDPAYREHVLDSIRRAAGSWSDFETRTREGRVLDTSWANVPLLDGSNIGIGIDITARQQAEQALQASIKQLRALAKQLQRVREEERKMLAREIHDGLGQTLTGLKMDLAWLRSNLPPAMEPEPLLLSETMNSMVELADRSIQEVRRLITQLRPPVLDNLGLEAAIEWQVGDLRQRTGIAGEFVSSLKGLTLDPNLATALFRILQEALTNVARHALATHIKIRLGKNDGALLLEIEDNGRGITASELEDSQSFGIMGMRERALVFGGEVNFIGQPGKGTTVRVLIPLESP